jgi:hypothetical protein
MIPFRALSNGECRFSGTGSLRFRPVPLKQLVPSTDASDAPCGAV